MNDCNICGTALGEPVFSSESDVALTSLCELTKGRVRIWSCPGCSHLVGDALPNTAKYYEADYRILLDHDDEDQIYEIQNEEIIYRTDHQITILLDKLNLPAQASLLDYGCAKASTPKKLLTLRNDIQVHLFDVSNMYREHWDRFVTPDRRAIHETPADWNKRFDVVTSFFALEHIPAPLPAVMHIAELLLDDGVFYGIVPDTFGNVADFVVIDHVNHFTDASLRTLLEAAGFVEIDIDANVHRGALVFTARKHGTSKSTQDLKSILARSKALADYWNGIGARIKAAESECAEKSIAIYGSGFYGAYIFSTLKNAERVACFLDRSPFQQTKKLFGKPIRAPEHLPADIDTLFVGLNPAIARATMERMVWLGKPPILVFLDEGK